MDYKKELKRRLDYREEDSFLEKDGYGCDKVSMLRLENFIDTLIEQSYKQGYFCGREDLKIEIIADFNNK